MHQEMPQFNSSKPKIPIHKIPDELSDAHTDKVVEEALASVEESEDVKEILDNALKIYISEFSPKNISPEERENRLALARKVVPDKEFRNEVRETLRMPHTDKDLLARKYAMKIRDVIEGPRTIN